MALEDFLGKTSEIEIIDFLAENPGMEYNQSEIGRCTGISRQTINYKIRSLISNGIVKVVRKNKNVNYYSLANNNIVKALIGSVFANSIYVAQQDDVLYDTLDEEETEQDEDITCYYHRYENNFADVSTDVVSYGKQWGIKNDANYNFSYESDKQLISA